MYQPNVLTPQELKASPNGSELRRTSPQNPTGRIRRALARADLVIHDHSDARAPETLCEDVGLIKQHNGLYPIARDTACQVVHQLMRAADGTVLIGFDIEDT